MKKNLNPKTDKNEKVAPPLIRLSSFAPFVSYFDKLGLNIDAVLAEIGTDREAVKQQDYFVPAESVYKLLDAASILANDPFLGVHVSETMDFSKIAMFFDAAKSSHTLGEFFVHYLAKVPSVANSVQHNLMIVEGMAEFTANRRIKNPAFSPAQSDGFGLSYIVRLFEAFETEIWTPKDVRVMARYTSAIPSNYKGMSVESDPKIALKIIFPSDWLLRRIQLHSSLSTRAKKGPVHSGNIQSIAGAVKILLEDQDFSTAKINAVWISKQIGISPRSLRSQLKEEGTTLLREINLYKVNVAKGELSDGIRSVSSVAEILGYTATAKFSRFFKSETGEAPSEYRNRKSIKE